MILAELMQANSERRAVELFLPIVAVGREVLTTKITKIALLDIRYPRLDIKKSAW